LESSIPKTDISLVSTVELLAELQERHQCSVFAGFHTLRVDEHGVGNSLMIIKHKGDPSRCMTLCDLTKHSSMMKLINNLEHEPEGE